MTSILLLLALVLQAVTSAQMSFQDRAVIPILRRVDAELRHFRMLHRSQVSENLDLLIALGGRESYVDNKGWGDREKLGLFLQERQNPDRVYTLAIEPGRSGCEAHIERFTAADAVISCRTWYGERVFLLKFIYETRIKALVHRVSYDPFYFSRVFLSGDAAIFVGLDGSNWAAVEYQPARRSAFRVLGDTEARPWTERIRTEESTFLWGREKTLYILPDELKPVRFGPTESFTLTAVNRSSFGPRLTILETAGGKSIEHALPQSSYDAFAAARPEEARGGQYRHLTVIEEEIGPWQLEGERLWFGKTFYDGEGHTGVGGFGYFDTKERRYRIFSPPEVVDWSVFDLRLHADAVWMALANRCEYGANRGGLLRFDRASETVMFFRFEDVPNRIAQLGDQILIAAETGIAILDGGRIERYSIERAPDGRLQVMTSSGDDVSRTR